ncbi:type III-B CRISPR module RAMP protein Cmr6 [Maridesulfovibrio hydrothermalis]|uniref:Putative CRISPR-associated RAMP protein, Cmr6 family n=1 Tax=Maridesulfovibrio hydrothermalis AM13 = DSM 14728 TaxID=1121451 RepID=L0R8X2_9BACT|nr:type III-B CRISPR module RAMP protein Cmr6 [Maridesulfovibrio hydrothermalis]CCO22021.1 putative CRISPR-associated RAMP protein, Cmr6 family [Maridesulfovibrio hydrothermalis AM13 = DSM 14728]
MKTDLQAVHPSLLMHKLGLHALIFEHPEKHSLSIAKPENNDHVGEKRTVLAALTKSVQDDNFRNIYKLSNQKWLEYLEKTGALILEAKTGSKFISGLSYGAAMHVGFSLHHTYGVPYIPGSSVKGACKAIASLEAKDEISDIYGEDDDSNGKVLFLDSFPVPLIKKISDLLVLDVITPHHTKGNSGEKGYESAPDIEEPVPVEFIVVPKGITFTFAFICQDEKHRDIVTKHWQLACDEGFGAKSSNGYGYFEPIKSTEEHPKPTPPEEIMKEFKEEVRNNKSILNNKLEYFVKKITDSGLPAETQKEMATLLVNNLGVKALKKKVKKDNKSALVLKAIWKS